jgi:endonuclease G
VHVVRKIHPKDKIFKDRPEDLIPKMLRSPSGKLIPTDVVTANYKLTNESPQRQAILQKPLSRRVVNRRKRLDPLVGGISIGSPKSPAGTLGALVWDKEDGSICILSNWHVLAGDLNAEVGNPCFQPSLFDQGRSTDVVAHLKRWSFNRQTDAAIAQLNSHRRYSTGEILDMFQTIKDVAEQVHLGMRVHKSSRSSGHSWGFIDGLYFSAAIAYSNGLVRVFEEQIHIAPLEDCPISEPGDSGSVWVTNASNEGYLAVGLHFAGDLPNSSFGEYALANPMSVVARRLNFSFRPLFLEIRDDNVIPSPSIAPQQPNGVGGPARFVPGGTLTGSGSQPFSNPIDPGGTG